MKYIALILFLCACNGQGKLPVEKITVKDEGVYEYNLLPIPDTLRFYDPGQDTFRVTVTFNRISTSVPMPDVVAQIDGGLNMEYPVLFYTPQPLGSEDNIVNPNGWTFTKNQITNTPHYMQTLSILVTDGWVETFFSGYKVEYWAEKFESYGIAGVSIDKGPETMVDLYHPTNVNNSTLVFTADSLDNDVQHTIRVRYTAQRNPNANSDRARINLDKFVTYQHQGKFYPPLPPTKSITYPPEK